MCDNQDYSRLIYHIAILHRRLELLEEQLDRIESQNEEILFCKFTERYYSEQLLPVRLQFQRECARIDSIARSVLELAFYLPDASRQRVESILRSSLSSRTIKDGRSSLTIMETEL